MSDDAIDRIRGAAETRQWASDGEAAEMMLTLLAALDTARRAALEEAIGVCADRVAVNQALAITLGHEHLTSRAEGADECIGDLRALIDTPRTDPVRTAPVSASEEP